MSDASGIFIRLNTNGDLIDAAMDYDVLQCTPIYFYNGFDNNYYVAGNMLGSGESMIMFGRFSGGFLLNNSEVSLNHGNFIIFPNPCSEYFSILSDFDQPYMFEIIDISGKPVLSQIINENLRMINISSLSKGIYFVKVFNQVSKLIIK